LNEEKACEQNDVSKGEDERVAATKEDLSRAAARRLRLGRDGHVESHEFTRLE
jgi:hypothetical protein